MTAANGAAILLNGEPPERGLVPLCEGRFVAACDGAAAYAERLGIAVDLLAGDFDSYPDAERFPAAEILRYPAEKNMTDGEIALDELLDRGYRDILFLGGGGLRDDHFFFNLQLLYRLLQRGGKGRFVTNYCEIVMENDCFERDLPAGTVLSVAPFDGQLHILSTSGLKYALRDFTMTAGSTRGLSNVADGDGHVRVKFGGGTALLFVVR